MLSQPHLRFQFPRKHLLQTALIFGFLSLLINQNSCVDGFLPKPGTFYWSPPRIRDVKAAHVSTDSTPLISPSKQSSFSKLETVLASFDRLLKNTSATTEYTKNPPAPVSVSSDFSLLPPPLTKEGLNFLQPQSKTYSNRDALARHEFWDVLEVFTVPPSGSMKSGPQTKTLKSNRPRRFGNTGATSGRLETQTLGSGNLHASPADSAFFREVNEQSRHLSKTVLNSKTKPSKNTRKYSFDSWRGKRSRPPLTTTFQTEINYDKEMNDRYKMTLAQKIKSDVEQSFNRLLRHVAQKTYELSVAHSGELSLSQQQQRLVQNRLSQKQKQTDRFENSLNIEGQRQWESFPLLRLYVDEVASTKQFKSAFKRGLLVKRQTRQWRQEKQKDWPRGCCPLDFTSNSTRSKVYAKFKKMLTDKIHANSLIGPDFQLEDSELEGSEFKYLDVKPGFGGKLKHSNSKENSHDGTSTVLDKMYNYLLTSVPPRPSPFRKFPDSLLHGRYKRAAVMSAKVLTPTYAMKQTNVTDNIQHLNIPRRRNVFKEWPIPLFKLKHPGRTNNSVSEQRQSEKGNGGVSKSRMRNLLSHRGTHGDHGLFKDSSTRNLSNAGNLLNMIWKMNNSVQTGNVLVGQNEKQTQNERSRIILLQSAQNLTNWRQEFLQFFFSEIKTRLNKLRVKQKGDRARHSGRYYGIKNQKTETNGKLPFSNYPHKPLFYDQFFKDSYHAVELVDEGVDKNNKSSWLDILENSNRGYFHPFNKREKPYSLATEFNSVQSPGPENTHMRMPDNSPFQIVLSLIPGMKTGVKMELSLSKSESPREMPFPVDPYTTHSRIGDLSYTLLASGHSRNSKHNKENTNIREKGQNNHSHQSLRASQTDMNKQNKIPKKIVNINEHTHRAKRSTWTINSGGVKKNISAQHKENSNSSKSTVLRVNSQKNVQNTKELEIVTRSNKQSLVNIKAKRPWWYSSLYKPPAGLDQYRTRTTYLYLWGRKHREHNAMKHEKRALVAQAPPSADLTNKLHRNDTAYTTFLFQLCRFILNQSSDVPELGSAHGMNNLEDVFQSIDTCTLIAKYRNLKDESTNKDSVTAFGRVGNTAASTSTSRLDLKIGLHRGKRHQVDPLKIRNTHLVWGQLFQDLKNEQIVFEDFVPKIPHKIRFKYFAKNKTSSDFSRASKVLNMKQWHRAPASFTSFGRMDAARHISKAEKAIEQLSRSENTGLKSFLWEMRNKTNMQHEDTNVEKRGAEMRRASAGIATLQSNITGPEKKQVVEVEDVSPDPKHNGKNNQKNREVFDRGNTQLNHTSDCHNDSAVEKRFGDPSTNPTPVVATVEKTGDTWVHRKQEELLQEIFGEESIARDVAVKESAGQRMPPCKALINSLTFVEPIGFSDFKD